MTKTKTKAVNTGVTCVASSEVTAMQVVCGDITCLFSLLQPLYIHSNKVDCIKTTDMIHQVLVLKQAGSCIGCEEVQIG